MIKTKYTIQYEIRTNYLTNTSQNPYYCYILPDLSAVPAQELIAIRPFLNENDLNFRFI